MPLHVIGVHGDRLAEFEGIEAHHVDTGFHQDAPLGVSAAVNPGDRAVAVNRVDHLGQDRHHVVALHGDVGGASEGRENRFVDGADDVFRVGPEHLDLPAALHRHRLDDHVAELLVVVERPLVLVHGGECEGTGTGGMAFHHRASSTLGLQPLLESMEPSGVIGRNRHRRAIARSLLWIHGRHVRLVEFGESLGVVPGGVEVHAALFPVDHPTGKPLGELHLHLLVESSTRELRPDRRLGDVRQNHVECPRRVVMRHAAHRGRHAPGPESHLCSLLTRSNAVACSRC